MGWWNVAGVEDVVIGDTVLDLTRHFLHDFSKEYVEDLGRMPSFAELESVLSLAFNVNLNSDLIKGMDELEIKQVQLKTVKRPKRIKPEVGDIFAFRYDNKTYGFGRLVADVSIGMVAELFDYFSSVPILDPTKKDKWLTSPIIINSYGLLDRRCDGDWAIIEKGKDYSLSENIKDIFFYYGDDLDALKGVRIDDSEFVTSMNEVERIGAREYSPMNDYQVKELIKSLKS